MFITSESAGGNSNITLIYNWVVQLCQSSILAIRAILSLLYLVTGASTYAILFHIHRAYMVVQKKWLIYCDLFYHVDPNEFPI